MPERATAWAPGDDARCWSASCTGSSRRRRGPRPQAAAGLAVGYVQTPGGGLPGSLSRDVAELRERGLLCGHVTAGPAYGGEGEAISVAGALHAAAGAGLGRGDRGARARASSARRPRSATAAWRRSTPPTPRWRWGCRRCSRRGSRPATRGRATAGSATTPETVLRLLLAPVRVPVPELGERSAAGRRCERELRGEACGDRHDVGVAAGRPRRATPRAGCRRGRWGGTWPRTRSSSRPRWPPAARSARGSGYRPRVTTGADERGARRPRGRAPRARGRQAGPQGADRLGADGPLPVPGRQHRRAAGRRPSRARSRSSPTTAGSSTSSASRARRSRRRRCWSSRPGKLDKEGETPLESAQRELARGDRQVGGRLARAAAVLHEPRLRDREGPPLPGDRALRRARRARGRREDRDREGARWRSSTRRSTRCRDAKSIIGLIALREHLASRA